jgi:transposase-like protein
VGARTPGDYPRTLAEFYRRFPDDDACLRYLVETRWPQGFRCLACGSDNAVWMKTRRVWQCRRCRHQTSPTAGTVMERSHLPLSAWFTTAYLMTSFKPGVSALQLQRQLGLASFKSAWVLLHKLRRAMVNPQRLQLSGTVEVDETWIGGKQAGLKGGRQQQNRKALLVAVAVERRAKGLGRLRLQVVPNASQETLTAFITANVASGSTIVSDAWSGYEALPPDYTHLSFSQAAMKRAGVEPDAVPGVHRVISNLKTWLRGTHHGVGADHLEHYLQEFVFRFNRRSYPMAGFATLLGLGAARSPTTVADILGPVAEDTKRRRGRATRLTSARFSVAVVRSASLEEALADLGA